MNLVSYKNQIISMATAIRILTVDAVQHAKSGHPGMPLGMAEVAAVLYKDFIKVSKINPEWHDRDRLVISAGHGSMLLYSALHLIGFQSMSLEDIKNFRNLNSNAAGHPENHVPGIDTTTGPLGQGIANAVGMAIAEQKLNSIYGDELVDHRVYVILGDGCMMEGISHEASSIAGTLKLSKITAIYDSNSVSIDGSTHITDITDTKQRFLSYGWDVFSCSAHDPEQIHNTIKAANNSPKPALIICHSVIGAYLPTISGTAAAHSFPISEKEFQLFKECLGWTHEPFSIPQNIYNLWGQCSCDDKYNSWKARVKNSPIGEDLLKQLSNNGITEDVFKAIHKYKASPNSDNKPTRQFSGEIISLLKSKFPHLFIGGSADLGESSRALTENSSHINANNPNGNYIAYGIREHGMCGIMNGIALHRGFVPYGSTFLIFSDYAKPAIRMAALMNLKLILIMSHDSIGVGEDGPTHQPVEQLASLRAIPNVNVLRPADKIETAECWEVALKSPGVSILCISRQATKAIFSNRNKNLSQGGGYIAKQFSSNEMVSIIATGSELAIALQVGENLHAKGIGSRIISVPILNNFIKQGSKFINDIIGENFTVVIEAGISMPWYQIVERNSLFISVSDFGKSAPCHKVYEFFGIEANAITKKIESRIR